MNAAPTVIAKDNKLCCSWRGFDVADCCVSSTSPSSADCSDDARQQCSFWRCLCSSASAVTSASRLFGDVAAPFLECCGPPQQPHSAPASTACMVPVARRLARSPPRLPSLFLVLCWALSGCLRGGSATKKTSCSASLWASPPSSSYCRHRHPWRYLCVYFLGDLARPRRISVDQVGSKRATASTWWPSCFESTPNSTSTQYLPSQFSRCENRPRSCRIDCSSLVCDAGGRFVWRSWTRWLFPDRSQDQSWSREKAIAKHWFWP